MTDNSKNTELQQSCETSVMRSAYGEYWDKVKGHLNDKGWCRIIPDLELTPGRCGMVATGYQVKRLEPNNNYMGWSHFRPNALMYLD